MNWKSFTLEIEMKVAREDNFIYLLFWREMIKEKFIVVLITWNEKYPKYLPIYTERTEAARLDDNT